MLNHKRGFDDGKCWVWDWKIAYEIREFYFLGGGEKCGWVIGALGGGKGIPLQIAVGSS